jgi:predicted DsbA family dithiol-disulfide isomerase
MVEDQIPLEKASAKPNQNWIWWLAGGAAILLICCIVLAVGVALFYLLAPTTGQVFSVISTEMPYSSPPVPSTVKFPEARSYPMSESNRLGDPNAPVKIVVYSDFQCPFCVKYWEETEGQVIENYVATGKVFYEFRSNGAFIGPESAAAAEAAYCAGAQNQFWEYHDILFANWTGENVGDFSDENLRLYASAINLNQNAFEQCLESGTYADRVRQDAANARSDGIHGTPSFLINGKLIEGAVPFSTFKSEIEAALNSN